MADRKKVLTQLVEIGIGLDMAGYHDDAQCVRDALVLLREQETVGVEKGIGYLYCGGCKTALAPLDWPKPWKFCPWCGRRVRWE